MGPGRGDRAVTAIATSESAGTVATRREGTGGVELRGHPDHTGWSDSSARAVLQLLVESVAEMVGFRVAVLSVVIDGELVTMAYTGPEEHREWLSQTDPVHVLDPVLERASAWGRLRFLAAEDYDVEELEGHWVAMAEHGAGPDAWHPHDALLATLRDDAGSLVGILSVDDPVSGRRPDAAQRRLLERYAAQAERGVITAVEREEMVKQIAHAESARRLVRDASAAGHDSLEAVVAHVHRPLVEGFDARGSWVHVVEPDGTGRGWARDLADEVVQLPADVVRLAEQLAPHLWRHQRVVVLGGEEADRAALEIPEVAPLLTQSSCLLARLGLGSALAVPLGVGPTCRGFLVLARDPGDPVWSAVERESALEIGHDLGASLTTAAVLERERRLVRELQQLDDHRSQVIATLSHELRTPLAVISGNLELLGDLDLAEASPYRDAMARGTARMQHVVEDLLLLTRVSDPRHPLERVPVDVRSVVEEVAALIRNTAQAKGLTLGLEIGEGPLVVPGDPHEIDRMLSNLASNAVKYTPAGGRVTMTAHRHGGRVRVQVCDDGLGIGEQDQAALFRAFFRTTNPEALRQPGTGLGLSIVAAVAERHGGEVAVESRLGEGTTFTVTLPAT